jgi:serine/threonine protein kinase
VTTLFEAPELRAGMTLRGKWKGQSYSIVRTLGAGANGTVYLVSCRYSHYALKVGLDPLDLQSEVNTLRQLSNTSTSFRGMLVDVDDFLWQGKEFPFFVMKYMEGSSLSRFIEKRGRDWVILIGLNLLRKLTELHAQGYVFGDLKMENVIVSSYGHVELIDFGGVTPLGRSVKQFTELYDRGFWSAGSRVAEETYDLFSFALLMMRAVDERDTVNEASKSLPQNRGVTILVEMAERAQLTEAASWLKRALTGGFASSRQAFEEWRKLLPHNGLPKRERAAVRGVWVSVCFALSVAVLAVTLYIYGM